MQSEERSISQGASQADHLCVLVHGLWGNPKHLAFVASALREKHPENELHILVAKSNSDSYTYDGIDLGAERVTQEIETYIEQYEKEGITIKKLSVVGYSLGGLVARYAIGLLYSREWFDKLEPVNFTTFATPHLGVRAPVLAVHHRLWNVLGSRTLSISGRQLFTIDSFRDTGRPLLSVLADPGSIFILALSRFRNRVLYANIINDRSAPYYTTSISVSDPFTNLDAITLNYVPDYSPNILNPENPVTVKPPETQPSFFARITGSSSAVLTRVPIFALLVVLIPVGSVVFLINSGVQSIRSQNRIRLHEAGKAGIGLGSYRVPLMIENARSTVEGAFRNINAGQRQEYLLSATPDGGDSDPDAATHASDHSEKTSWPGDSSNTDLMDQVRGFPTLALTPEQFEMVQALDRVRFKKFRVHIQRVRHTHAAIIVRIAKESFQEGKVVVRHWLDEEFEI